MQGKGGGGFSGYAGGVQICTGNIPKRVSERERERERERGRGFQWVCKRGADLHRQYSQESERESVCVREREREGGRETCEVLLRGTLATFDILYNILPHVQGFRELL